MEKMGRKSLQNSVKFKEELFMNISTCKNLHLGMYLSLKVNGMSEFNYLNFSLRDMKLQKKC